MKLALIILTFNEIEGSTALYDNIPFDAADETIVIDGGSTDGTVEFWEGKGIRVMKQTTRGRGNAFRMAYDLTDADILVFFSPDGNEDPNDIVKFRPLVEQNADMVIASRMMKGAHNEEDDQVVRLRKWANNAFTLISNLLWNRPWIKGTGSYITDTINGYRAVTREAFGKIFPDAEGFCIEYQMSIRSMKKGLRVVEFPTFEGERIGGESTAKSIQTGLRFLKLLFHELMN